MDWEQTDHGERCEWNRNKQSIGRGVRGLVTNRPWGEVGVGSEKTEYEKRREWTGNIHIKRRGSRGNGTLKP